MGITNIDQHRSLLCHTTTGYTNLRQPFLTMSSPPPHHKQTSTDPMRTLDSLSTTWQHHKKTAAFPQRLGMRVLEVVALAAAMFIVPTFIHRVVQSFDDVYELLGRRARSPYSPAIPWTSVIISFVLLAGWHFWLGRLSYKTIIESNEDAGSKRRVSWGRVLGRIVMPLFLLSFGLQFAYLLFERITKPAPIVIGNVVR